MPDLRRCPQCGAPIAPDVSTDGLCSRCLLRLGLAAEDGNPSDAPAMATFAHAPCRILTLLGAGPAGRTYLAEQERPHRRLVAVTLIDITCTPDEAQKRIDGLLSRLLALDHPGLVPVFDGGITENRQAYLVSEYQPASSIVRYCERSGLAPAGRLLLFAAACDAVQHAHAAGLVHGHLAAANVLIAGRAPAVPRIGDFGVAFVAGKDVGVADDVEALRAVLAELLPRAEEPGFAGLLEDRGIQSAGQLADAARRLASGCA
jgi:hypothetical protein